MVLPRFLLIAAALALPATASASVTKVTTPADDYLLGQTTPVTVKLKPAPKSGKVKVFVDDAQQGKPVAVKGRKAVQVTAAFPKTGEVTVKGCLSASCKTKKVRVHAPAPTPTPATDQTYKLTLTAGSLSSRTDASRAPNADTYCGNYGFELHSVKTVSGQLSSSDADNLLTVGADGHVEGNANGTATTQFEWPQLRGCKTNPDGGGVVRCDATHSQAGTSSVGFSIASIPGDAAHVKLTWILPLPDGGFVDFGDDVCNVSEIAQYPRDEKEVTTVALADLISGKPLTLTNAGDDSYGSDFQGKPAIIATNWSETVTVQAVKQ